jgi:hypothetical protein
MLRSAKFQCRRRATKSLASMWSYACGARLSTLCRRSEKGYVGVAQMGIAHDQNEKPPVNLLLPPSIVLLIRNGIQQIDRQSDGTCAKDA